MLQYKFNNGVVLSGYKVRFLDSCKVVVDGKITNDYTPLANPERVFFENAKEVRVYQNETNPSIARLHKETLMLDTEISLHQYSLLDSDLKKLYYLTDEITEEKELKYSYIETGVDYLGEPSKLTSYFKIDGKVSLDKYTPKRFNENEEKVESYDIASWESGNFLYPYVPASIDARNLVKAIEHSLHDKGAVRNIANDKGSIEVYSVGNEITVTHYESPYEGELERYQLRKRNGEYYANPRYGQRKKLPNVTNKISLKLPYGFELTGENSFDLANKIEKIAEEFLR